MSGSVTSARHGPQARRETLAPAPTTSASMSYSAKPLLRARPRSRAPPSLSTPAVSVALPVGFDPALAPALSPVSGSVEPTHAISIGNGKPSNTHDPAVVRTTGSATVTDGAVPATPMHGPAARPASSFLTPLPQSQSSQTHGSQQAQLSRSTPQSQRAQSQPPSVHGSGDSARGGAVGVDSEDFTQTVHPRSLLAVTPYPQQHDHKQHHQQQ